MVLTNLTKLIVTVESAGSLAPRSLVRRVHRLLRPANWAGVLVVDSNSIVVKQRGGVGVRESEPAGTCGFEIMKYDRRALTMSPLVAIAFSRAPLAKPDYILESIE